MDIKLLNEELEKQAKIKEELVNQANEVRDNMANLIEKLDLSSLDNYSYSESKELLSLAKKFSYGEAYDKNHRFNLYLKAKKETEYPELRSVHYYPELRELIGAKEENELIKLDKALKSSYKKRYIIHLETYIEESLEFLIEKKIIEKLYEFRCNCYNNDDCITEYITEERYEKMKIAWESKDDEDWEDGYFYRSCWNEGGYEVYNQVTFDENLTGIRYKVVKEPDISLDEI